MSIPSWSAVNCFVCWKQGWCHWTWLFSPGRWLQGRDSLATHCDPFFVLAETYAALLTVPAAGWGLQVLQKKTNLVGGGGDRLAASAYAGDTLQTVYQQPWKDMVAFSAIRCFQTTTRGRHNLIQDGRWHCNGLILT